MRPYSVVCSADDPNWLSERHKRLTGSDVAAMLGVSPWKKVKDLLHEKSQPAAEWKDTRNMWHGRYSEDHNRKKFSHITGIRSRPCHLFLESTAYPKLGATLDGLVASPVDYPETVTVAVSSPPWVSLVITQAMDAGGVGLLEMKQTEAWWGKNWKKSPPMHYWIQIQAQMYVTGHKWGILACQVGAADMWGYFIPKDKDFHTELSQACKEFCEWI